MKLSLLAETVQTVAISSLLMTKSELIAAVSNITRGHLAQTEGPVKVVYLEAAGAYHLVNGYHRMVEFLVNGQDQIQVDIEGTATWGVPSSDDTFVHRPEAQYGGLEDFIEPYLLRRL